MDRIVATWKTAQKYIAQAYALLGAGKSVEDALEWAVGCVEDDRQERTVGYGGGLNREGVAELDASFMEGSQRRMGAVAGLVGYAHPVSVARLVMEKTPHNLLHGAGAADFARQMGCTPRDMASKEALEEYYARKLSDIKKPSHDTVGMIGLSGGHVAVAMSTSGFFYRMPGRTSDTAVPACGYFADDHVGGVVCTGAGEDIMRGALAARAFLYMEQGESPEKAAQRAVADTHRRLSVSRIALVCMDMQGNFAGAANHEEFSVSYTDLSGNAQNTPVPYCFAGTDIPVGEELYL